MVQKINAKEKFDKKNKQRPEEIWKKTMQTVWCAGDQQ